MNGIEIDGMEAFTKILQDMTISKTDEKRAMQKAIEPIYEETYNNAPYATGKLREGIEKQVKMEGLSIVGIIKLGTWYSKFHELGTSKYKGHVGFFARSVENMQGESLSILANELLSKTR